MTPFARSTRPLATGRGTARTARLTTCALAMAACIPGIALASRSGVAAAAVPGIVDINTNLGYEQAAAAGTGMVLTSSGEILTNNHVIRGATTIRVTDIDNGNTYAATVVGYNVAADIAVLQLKNASGLQTAPLGNSATTKVGDPVTAIGNAGGVGGTPSALTGVITHLHQSITASDGGSNPEQLSGLIETNAPLQPGDSGGPLVDQAGQVIGMDTAASASFAFQSQSSQGFSIPINHATSVAHQIETKVAAVNIHIGPTPFLGVDVQPSSSFPGQAPSTGLIIAGVVQGSPIERAGLKVGDVIGSVDGHTITSPATLTSLLITKSPGTTVKLVWVDQTGTHHSSTLRLASGPPQ